MSRIHEIIKKAERDGAVRRTRGAADADRPVEPVRTHAPHAEIAVREEAGPWPASVPPPPAPDEAAVPAADEATPGRLDPLLVSALEPQSPAAEQFRALRTRLALAENGNPLRVVVVTSPGKGDGKTVTAANLALAMAQEYHRRVLLVEADLRRPRLQQLLGMTGRPGLTDTLMGAARLEEALAWLPEHRLTVLTAGAPAGRPAELLASAGMRRLLDTLRARFDSIIIDAPPAMPLADVGILAPLTDGALLVVRAGVTPRPAIERALDSFGPARVLGVVLNDAGTRLAGYDDEDAFG